MKKLIIDFSVMMHQSWHQMFSPNYEPSFSLTRKDSNGMPDLNTELEEYLLNLSRNIFYIKCRFMPDEIIFALDAKTNWRKYFIADYYDARLLLWEDLTEGLKHKTYYTVVDGVTWRFEQFYQTMQWSKKRLTNVELKSVNLDDESRFNRIHNSNIIKSLELWEAVMRHTIPYYKDHRSLSNWKGVTDKTEWKKASIKYAYQIAGIMGASVITVPYAEGDDIIASLVMDCSTTPNDPVIVVSVDQDLYQLGTLHPNFYYYNPLHHKLIDINPDQARFKLLCKISGGDGSDNINGIMINGNTLKEVSFSQGGDVKNGKTTISLINGLIRANADKGVIGSKLYEPAYKYLEKMAENDSFYKNMVCIYLKNIPDLLQERISEAVLHRSIPKTDCRYVDLGITGMMKKSIANRAITDGGDDSFEGGEL